MYSPPTGGPVFASKNYEGLTLRDYFATAAMQGNIASLTQEDIFTASLVAQWSYEVADEMLKARDKK